MTEMSPHGSGIETMFRLWFSLTALSVVFVARDQFRPGQSKRTHRWDWLLYTLYTGPFSLFLYLSLGRGETDNLWKQAGRSTVQCGAGQLTGMLLAALLAIRLGLSPGWELGAEYFGGLLVGLFLFQAPAAQASFAGSYWRAVRGSWLSETLAMNAMMAGMVPVTAMMMSLGPQAMQPASVLFWGAMSFAFIAGSLTTYPLKWLFASGFFAPRSPLTEGAARQLAALLVTLALLAGAVGLARHYGGPFGEAGPTHKSME